MCSNVVCALMLCVCSNVVCAGRATGAVCHREPHQTSPGHCGPPRGGGHCPTGGCLCVAEHGWVVSGLLGWVVNGLLGWVVNGLLGWGLSGLLGWVVSGLLGWVVTVLYEHTQLMNIFFLVNLHICCVTFCSIISPPFVVIFTLWIFQVNRSVLIKNSLKFQTTAII